MSAARPRWAGAVFALGLAAVGFVAGTAAGAWWFVPPASGLAGPAIALGYGLLGAALGLVAGLALARRLAPRVLARAAVPAGLAGIAVAGLIAWSVVQSRAAQRAALAEAYAGLNAFRVTLIAADPALPFRRVDADWGTRRLTVGMAGPGPRLCTASLAGADAVALLGSLRDIGALLIDAPVPCATGEDTGRRLDWFIPEGRPPDTAGRLSIDPGCRVRFPVLDRPFEVAADIVRAARDMRCR